MANAPIQSVLIANRGEIAVRIARSVQEQGMTAIAVYSEADAEALHVRVADKAVAIGPAPVTKSYLKMDNLIAAAKESGADAVHPGYGLLSESADFADAVIAAGLCWIGPPVAAMRAMASKTAARATMVAAGVPVVPGGDLSDAASIGFPVLVKAAAGGGGKGMRRVDKPADLAEAAATCAREAEAAFGSGEVYIEKLMERPRHVEIQVFGDSQGNVVHLFERECSIQRRHQKVIEESPCPILSEALRDAMGDSAVAAARAVGYVGAGTVEFLLDGSDFYFLEMNTRLQVEHPVTEWVTGVDLVAEQLSVAQGNPLSFTQDTLQQQGHAIECRLYAEDPTTFLPQTGTIMTLVAPEGTGIRNDTGIYPGWAVDVHYDPMLAKLSVWADTREEAIKEMARALRNYVVLGCGTNLALLSHVVEHPAFAAGDTNTAFLTEHPFTDDGDIDDLAYVACALAMAMGRLKVPTLQAADDSDAYSPWTRLGNWRLST
jgi:acetyl-CoA carboxylase biotin carboxylase subunit